MVKKLTRVFWIGIIGLLLIVNVHAVFGTQVSEHGDLTFNATGARPVFKGLSEGSDGQIIVARDDSQHQGAVILANKGDNVTVIYSFEEGNNETLPLIFGDDGNSGNNLSWTTPTPMIYDVERTNQSTTNEAFYNFTFHVNSDFIVFLVRLNNYEDDYKIPNIITTGVRIESDFVDEYYTQFDDINMTLTFYKYNITEYGLQYRVDTEGHTGEFSNVTFTYSGSGDNITLYANFTHTFPIGTTLDVRPFIKYYDSTVGEFRYYHENKAHLITIIDGTPTITLHYPQFTNSLNVSISWEVEFPKGNLTQTKIDWGDDSAEQVITNTSITEAYHLYSSDGKYNITVTAYAGTAVGSKTEEILIDRTAPQGTITLKEENVTTITSGLKRVTFLIDAKDNKDGSGIEKYLVVTDEGNAYEYEPSIKEITLEFLDFGPHTVNLTVYDKAGNTYTTSVSFVLTHSTIPEDSPLPFPFGLFSIIGLVAISLFVLRKRR
ncbi:MAG: hypothetical protein ACTSYD_05525 [Candidatus Heimdallarchaeaceae archaeon]